MKELNLRLDELDEFVKTLPTNGVILLFGDLASGKTTLTQRIASNLGIKSHITSPTFSIMQSYENKLFHYDIYQFGYEKLLLNGLFENFFEKGLHIVEWADENLVKLLIKNEIKFISIKIAPNADNSRKYKVDYAYA